MHSGCSRNGCGCRLGRPGRGPGRRGAPEAGTGWYSGGLATATSRMVAAANPHAVEAGLEILRAGGSAADAAVAVQLVLNLVEPQSSGIGGGAFVMHWDAAAKRLGTYDGRETAPAAATGRPVPGRRPAAQVRRCGVRRPERRRAWHAVAVLEAVHRSHGRLPWARLFAPAIRLAGDGFRVSPRLHLLLRWYGAESFRPGRAPLLLRYHRQRPPCRLPAPQSRVRGHPARHRRARRRRRSMRDAIAEAIVKAVREAPNHKGDITARRPCRLSRQGARARLRPLPRAIASAAWARPPPADWPSPRSSS